MQLNNQPRLELKAEDIIIYYTEVMTELRVITLLVYRIGYKQLFMSI